MHHSSPQSAQVQVVRIACEGEVRELDVPKYQAVSLPVVDPIFRGDDETVLSELSRFLGIPLVARTVPVDAYMEMDMTNSEASSLFRNCDISTRYDSSGNLPTSPATVSRSSSESRNTNRIVLPFGSVPVQWALDPGPVVLARLDQKPLHPLHAAAICAFCARYLRSAFQECAELERNAQRRSSGASEPSGSLSLSSHPVNPATVGTGQQLYTSISHETLYERRRNLLALVTPASFDEFFEQYKVVRVRGRPDRWRMGELDYIQRMERWGIPPDEIEPRPEWENVSSPFDV
jgi:hypothetical protein